MARARRQTAARMMREQMGAIIFISPSAHAGPQCRRGRRYDSRRLISSQLPIGTVTEHNRGSDFTRAR